jgi:hypothetical protein
VSQLLRSSCGIFTKLRGTEQVIHYTKKFIRNTFLEMEASEITQMRSLRFAAEQNGMDSIQLNRPTFSLYLSAMVAEIVQHLPSGTPIRQLGARLSPELESLKFLFATKKLALHSGQIRCTVNSNEDLQSWVAMHQRMESSHFGELADVEIGSHDGFNWLADLPTAQLVFLNAFKTASNLAHQLVTWLGENESRASFLIALRCASRATEACNVLKEEFVLPAYGSILESLSRKGWLLAYRLVPNLDRDFLLPFDGEYGVMVLFATRNPSAMGGASKLQRFDINQAARSDIAIFDRKQTENYDLSLASDLPTLGEPEHPDWNLWCNGFNWNPAEVDLAKWNSR